MRTIPGLLLVCLLTPTVYSAQSPQLSTPGAEPVKRILLLGSKRDHPAGRHEYMSGLRVLARCLDGVAGIRAEVVAADEPWADGPERLKKADGVVLYLGEGAKWLQATPARAAAMQDLARRGGGIVAFHSGIMSKDAKFVPMFRDLVGGCHGGPDRRYVFLDGDIRVANRNHAIAQGIADLKLHDEFYFRLKFAKQGHVEPVLQVPIEGQLETVAWAYERPDGGRSFGYSGMDPHENWRQVAYRRLAVQAVLWSVGRPIPPGGVPVEIAEKDLRVIDSK